MVGGKSSGNPNVIEDTFGKQTGPRTQIGKLKTSVNAIKHYGAGRKVMKNKPSPVRVMMEEAGVDFSKAGNAIEKRNLFEIFIKSKSTEELTEIQRLDGVIQVLDTDMSLRVMGKLEKGVPLNEADVRLVRLLKDCLSTSHELKFGKKSTVLKANYDDLRKLMFGDENDPEKDMGRTGIEAAKKVNN